MRPEFPFTYPVDPATGVIHRWSLSEWEAERGHTRCGAPGAWVTLSSPESVDECCPYCWPEAMPGAWRLEWHPITGDMSTLYFGAWAEACGAWEEFVAKAGSHPIHGDPRRYASIGKARELSHFGLHLSGKGSIRIVYVPQ